MPSEDGQGWVGDSVSLDMVKISQFIASREKSANVVLSPEARRRITANLAAAGISGSVREADALLASQIIMKAMNRISAETVKFAGACPRCSGPTRSVKILHPQGNIEGLSVGYCQACRVVPQPDSV